MANPTTPGEAIAGRLLAADATAVYALVGSRVYPSVPSQEPTGDYVVYFRTGGGDGMNLGGRRGLQQYEMRVEATSSTEGGAESILGAVSGRLAGWRDLSAGVQGCFPVGDSDESTLEDGRQVSGQTYSLWFKPQT